MAASYWIKLYNEALRDPKMGRLSDSAFRRCIQLFLLAGERQERDGSLPNIRDMVYECRVSQEQLKKDLAELEEEGIIIFQDDKPFVKNFLKRQVASSNAERMKEYRQRTKNEQSSQKVTEIVTKSNDVVTGVTDQITDIQITDNNSLATSAAEYHEFRQEWARYFPDKAQPRENNKTVQQKLKTRMQSKHFKENWQIALERASGSKFLRQSGFFDVSWFLQNENNYEKCLNGNYDDKPPLFNQNGHHPNGAMDKQQLLSHLWGIVVKFGRRGYHQAKEQLTENQLKILSKIGRWEDIANLSQDDFKFRFYEAYKEAA